MSRLKTEYDFMAGMYLDGELHFNRYRMLVDFTTLSDTIEDHNVGVDRMHYFINEVVQRSVFMCETEVAAITEFSAAGIPVLTVPEPGPFDPVVQAVIVTKMNCMLEDTLVVTDAELNSLLGGDITYVFTLGDGDAIHDVINDEDDADWWASPEPRFMSYQSGTNVSNHEKTSPWGLTWDMLELGWDDATTAQEIVFTPDNTPPDGDKSTTIINIKDYHKK
jgi:hypothetical protein